MSSRNPMLRAQRFEYTPVGDELALLRLFAEPADRFHAPREGSLFVVSDGGRTSHPARACVLRPTPAGLLWRGSFALPLEVVTYPEALFTFVIAGRQPLTLTAPQLREQVLPDEEEVRCGLIPLSYMLRRAAVVATVLTVTAGYSPTLALAAGGRSADAGHHKQLTGGRPGGQAAAAIHAVAPHRAPVHARTGASFVSQDKPARPEAPVIAVKSVSPGKPTHQAKPARPGKPTHQGKPVRPGTPTHPDGPAHPFSVHRVKHGASSKPAPAPAPTPAPTPGAAPNPTHVPKRSHLPKPTPPVHVAPPHAHHPAQHKHPLAGHHRHLSPHHRHPVAHHRHPLAHHEHPLPHERPQPPSKRAAPQRSAPSPVPSVPIAAPTGAITPTSLQSANPALARELSRLSALLARGNQPPMFLVPIYRAAARRYHVPWKVLAAINAIETDYGRNMNISSAGAIGWMQFMPDTWTTWAVATGGRRKADPYNPRDAIFSAARYLAGAGARHNLRKAIFAYNHAQWYVDEVLLTAQTIRGPSGLPGNAAAREKVQAMIAMAELLAGKPYIWGGGHSDWSIQPGYDCSGFVSAVLHSAGYLSQPQSTETLPSQPEIAKGAGEYVTIFDRTGAGGNSHVIIDLDGHFYESGGSAADGGGAGVKRIKMPTPAYLASFNQVLHPVGL